MCNYVCNFTLVAGTRFHALAGDWRVVSYMTATG
jgi:hypothetical protein